MGIVSLKDMLNFLSMKIELETGEKVDLGSLGAGTEQGDRLAPGEGRGPRQPPKGAPGT